MQRLQWIVSCTQDAIWAAYTAMLKVCGSDAYGKMPATIVAAILSDPKTASTIDIAAAMRRVFFATE